MLGVCWGSEPWPAPRPIRPAPSPPPPPAGASRLISRLFFATRGLTFRVAELLQGGPAALARFIPATHNFSSEAAEPSYMVLR